MIRIEDVLDIYSNNRPDGDVLQIQKAYVFANMMHEYQKRKSGLPFITHPLNVAYNIAENKLDTESVVAALLHDVVEDTDASKDQVEELFGKDVAGIVDGLTKLSALENVDISERKAANFKKLLIAIAKDPRVLIIKLADRLDNMRTLEFMKPEKQKLIAGETLEIYAPLAHAIGMARIKNELEDLSFRYLYPEEYETVSNEAIEKESIYADDMKQIRDVLEHEMKANGVRCIIQSRIKHKFSIFRKMKTQDITLDEVYDFLAFRIILTDNDPNECYKVIGILHGLWTYIPHRWRDFVSQPKENGYRSVHTTLIYEDGVFFEVQVRTKEMHEIAEQGIAAHWQYKQDRTESFEESRLYQVLSQTILDLKEKTSDEFLTDLAQGLKDISHGITVLTPRGRTIALPDQATPVDFAYSIHTEVGNHCVGAKVDGRLVPLHTELHDGNIVEILTNPNAKPSLDWLKLVRTSRAKHKIRATYRALEREEKTADGREMLEKAMRKNKIPFSQMDVEKISKAYKAYKISKVEELYFLVGNGTISINKVLGIIEPSLIRKKQAISLGRKPTEAGNFEKRVRIQGLDNLLVTRARCCNAIFGDPIIGYLTKLKGISVHRADCENLKQGRIDPARLIDVEWVEDPNHSFLIEVIVITEDITGMLARLTDVFDSMNLNLRKVQGESFRVKNQAQFRFTVQISSREELNRVLIRIKGTRGVLSVWRKK
ncbi:MAG: bifunctional (p)ppGpp synthetase/guanosine-3',5'-bis(diphosphate) 3'-pyrophosphohydrolase [Acidobacteria bacterium]|nr:bifunctional (p)ppGpp synthetase/guanosine-3',5'-bis(diphosphate) 3'-pyrophosphohydrolase [Acidobacteriota bacterium]